VVYRLQTNQLYLRMRRQSAPPLFRDMITVIDRLPTKEECVRTRRLVLQPASSQTITDDDLTTVLSSCPYLETVVLSGVQDTTNRTIVALATTASHLQGIDVTGCELVTDIGILELMTKSLPLQWIRLNGVVGLTDPTISAIAKSCSRLVELELCDLPLITALSVRDLWSFSRKLRTLRLAGCPLLTDKAFPSSVSSDIPGDSGSDKPLPPNPSTWPDELPPLELSHTTENLRVLDLGNCVKLTDDAIEGIVTHAPKIQTLVLSGCSLLTDRTVESICKLGDSLDVLMLAHVANITDPAIVKLARSCLHLRSIDLACELPLPVHHQILHYSK
jgi:F-box and leucine-rich repeat protein GRR1